MRKLSLLLIIILICSFVIISCDNNSPKKVEDVNQNNGSGSGNAGKDSSKEDENSPYIHDFEHLTITKGKNLNRTWSDSDQFSWLEKKQEDVLLSMGFSEDEIGNLKIYNFGRNGFIVSLHQKKDFSDPMNTYSRFYFYVFDSNGLDELLQEPDLNTWIARVMRQLFEQKNDLDGYNALNLGVFGKADNKFYATNCDFPIIIIAQDLDVPAQLDKKGNNIQYRTTEGFELHTFNHTVTLHNPIVLEKPTETSIEVHKSMQDRDIRGMYTVPLVRFIGDARDSNLANDVVNFDIAANRKYADSTWNDNEAVQVNSNESMALYLDVILKSNVGDVIKACKDSETNWENAHTTK